MSTNNNRPENMSANVPDNEPEPDFVENQINIATKSLDTLADEYMACIEILESIIPADPDPASRQVIGLRTRMESIQRYFKKIGSDITKYAEVEPEMAVFDATDCLQVQAMIDESKTIVQMWDKAFAAVQRMTIRMVLAYQNGFNGVGPGLLKEWELAQISVMERLAPSGEPASNRTKINPRHDIYDRLEIKELFEDLEISEQERHSGIILHKRGTIGRDYYYEVRATGHASKHGLYDGNIVVLRITAQCSGVSNHVLAEYRFSDWDILIPMDGHDLLQQAIDKVVAYYAPKD